MKEQDVRLKCNYLMYFFFMQAGIGSSTLGTSAEWSIPVSNNLLFLLSFGMLCCHDHVYGHFFGH